MIRNTITVLICVVGLCLCSAVSGCQATPPPEVTEITLLSDVPMPDGFTFDQKTPGKTDEAIGYAVYSHTYEGSFGRERCSTWFKEHLASQGWEFLGEKNVKELGWEGHWRKGTSTLVLTYSAFSIEDAVNPFMRSRIDLKKETSVR